MSSIAIQVENLSKRYRIGRQKARYSTLRESLVQAASSPLKWLSRNRIGENFIWALDDVSFEVEQGEAVGIIGRNGAGKSTLLKILSRVTKPTKGRVKLYGRVGSLLEVGTGFHPELTGRENIYLNGAILGMSRQEVKSKFDEIVAFAEVERFLDTPVKYYSSGMYMRLAFAVAAHMEPEILVVDEVLAVGDINFRRKCMGKMRDVSHGGRTVLFVSHDMSSIRQLCAQTMWIDGGEIVEVGDTEAVVSNYENQAVERWGTNTGRSVRDPVPGNDFFTEWVELRDSQGRPRATYRYGESMEIVLSLNGRAPQNAFTVEWILKNERGSRISFGAANPLGNTYFNREDKVISCRLPFLPLTTGKYSFYFSVRVWGLERWDEWDNSIYFEITHCDPFETGFNLPGEVSGDFVMEQNWSSQSEDKTI